jgi:hypothetical protein
MWQWSWPSQSLSLPGDQIQLIVTFLARSVSFSWLARAEAQAPPNRRYAVSISARHYFEVTR